MIYKKDANFPYPILTNTSNSYDNCSFILDIDLEENTNEYIFEIKYDITSPFIQGLLKNGQATLILIIKSKDNKFFNIEYGQKSKSIPKSRISLSNKTTIQLFIQSNEKINFKNNHDLDNFYDEFRSEVEVPKNAILGFSNSVIFNGSNNKPLELFEKKVNPNLKSDVKIELCSETIIINYKNESLQFTDLPQSITFNNPYVYMGLQKALYRFIVNNSEDHESVDLEEMEPPNDGLDFKLYNLMRKKKISELNIENIDVVSLMKQTLFELEDILEEACLLVRKNMPKEKVILPLDSQRTFRVFENLIINITKYAMPNTRVFIDIIENEDDVAIIMKNMAAEEITFNVDTIAERFVRGDESRNTEGSGLGLAIAKSFVELQGGTFNISVDGDLFKVKIVFVK